MIALIREASLAQLRDRRWLEDAIAELGLGQRGEEFPEHMHRYFGGLGIWQYPCQLAPYLICLSEKGIRSYAEIGLAAGGTFILTVEYLSRFERLESAIGVDISLSPSVRAYENPAVELIQGTSEALRGRRVDLAFIDADHSEEACQADYDAVDARYVGFHDLVESTCPGVARVWERVEGTKREFTDQYLAARPTYGIGLVER